MRNGFERVFLTQKMRNWQSIRPVKQLLRELLSQAFVELILAPEADTGDNQEGENSRLFEHNSAYCSALDAGILSRDV